MPTDPEHPEWTAPGTHEGAVAGDAASMPGYWVLAHLGKRVLPPGGVELTRWLLETLAVGRRDQVVELASGSGTTARLTLARHPESYVGVDRDSARTGLPDGCASVVYGEAMLTMRPEPARRRVVAEAHRLLAPSGRYGIHELCLMPDDIDITLSEEITIALSDAIQVGARLRTVPGWRELLISEGFAIVAEATVPMRLLEPSRLVADEKIRGAVRIAVRMMRDAAARRRALQMRGVVRSYRRHLAAVALVAVRP